MVRGGGGEGGVWCPCMRPVGQRCTHVHLPWRGAQACAIPHCTRPRRPRRDDAKKLIASWFPGGLYDTKHLAAQLPPELLLTDTSLGPMFKCAVAAPGHSVTGSTWPLGRQPSLWSTVAHCRAVPLTHALPPHHRAPPGP